MTFWDSHFQEVVPNLSSLETCRLRLQIPSSSNSLLSLPNSLFVVVILEILAVFSNVQSPGCDCSSWLPYLSCNNKFLSLVNLWRFLDILFCLPVEFAQKIPLIFCYEPQDRCLWPPFPHRCLCSQPWLQIVWCLCSMSQCSFDPSVTQVTDFSGQGCSRLTINRGKIRLRQISMKSTRSGVREIIRRNNTPYCLSPSGANTVDLQKPDSHTK